MKKLLTIIGICVFTVQLHAQGVRVGDSLPVQSKVSVPGVSSNVIVAIPNATLSFCTSPANGVPCTNKAITYTDATLTTSCSTSTQIVLAGTSTCTGTTDATGKWGVWVPSGQYTYTVTVQGASSGPFFITAGGSGGGGGGGSTVAGPDTAIQFNNNSTQNGVSALTFNQSTNTLGLPDGSSWTPAGLFPPNPSTNNVLAVDSSPGKNHAFVLKSLVNGQVCLQGGGGGFNFTCVSGDTYNGGPPSASLQAGDASLHFVGLTLFPFGTSHADQLGYTFANGVFQVNSDLNPGPGCLFCVDRVNKSIHFYGPLYLPDNPGTGNSVGLAGAALISQGAGKPPIYSSDATGPVGMIGAFGSLGGFSVSGSQSAWGFGPSGHMQASFAGDTFQDLMRADKLTITQYNVPEGVAGGVGLGAGPFNDSSDSIISALHPVDLGTNPLASDLANCSSTGTTLNKLVKGSSSAGVTCAVIAATTDTQGELGVCTARCGTTGTAVIAYSGQASLVMDGATTVNDWVINSSTTAGDGHDTGSTTCPTSGSQVIGRVLSTNGSGGTYLVRLGGCDTTGSGGSGLPDPGGNGITVRTALNTTTNRSIATADSTHISVTNGDGVSGNPTVDIGSNVAVLNAANTAGASMTLDLHSASVTAGLRLPNGAGAAPTAAGAISWDTTNNRLQCGDGTNTKACVEYPLIAGGAAGTVPASTTNFSPIMGAGSTNASENIRQLGLPVSGIIRNLCVHTLNSQPSTGTLTIILHDATNNADVSGLSVVIATSAAGGVYCDTTNTSTVVAGRDYTWKLTEGVTNVSAQVGGISAIYRF